MGNGLREIRKTKLPDGVRRATKVATPLTSFVVFCVFMAKENWRWRLDNFFGALVSAVITYFATWFLVQVGIWIRSGFTKQ
jgi:hypothetical protein